MAQAVGLVPPKTWTIACHADATVCDVEPWVMRKVADMQTLPTDSVNILAQVRHKPPHPLRQKIAGLAEMAGSALLGLGAVAAPVAGFLTWGAVGLLAAPLAPVLAFGGALMALDGLGRWACSKRFRPAFQEPAWQGTRNYLVTASPSHDNKRVDAPVVGQSDLTAPPGPKRLGRVWTQAFQKFPSEHTMVVLGGHATPNYSIGQVTLDDFVGSLKETFDATGKKVDIVVLEGCEMATLETMARIYPYARYIVAAQDIMNVTGLPWKQIMKANDGALPADAREAAIQLAERTGGRLGMPTISVIDAEKVPALLEAVDHLGNALQGVDKKAVHAALAGTTTFPQSLPGPLGYLQKKFQGECDLGELAQRVQSSIGDSHVQQAASAVQEALGEAVVTKRNKPALDGHANGISVRTLGSGFVKSSYTRENGMPQWAQLLHRMRPWPMKFFGIDRAVRFLQ